MGSCKWQEHQGRISSQTGTDGQSLNIQTYFDIQLVNHRHSVVNPVMTCLRQSDPQIVFVPSESAVVGLHMTDGKVVLNQPVTKNKVNTLVSRPHHLELYYGTENGEISVLRPGSENDQVEATISNQSNTLRNIYRSLIETPFLLP
jgi:hypothetical protein